jgi:hypothetical protein
MTEQEEHKLYSGPFPWKKSGFVVAFSGVATWHVPPKHLSSITGEPQVAEKAVEANRFFSDGRHSITKKLEEFSRGDLHAEIEMTRRDLAGQWVELQRLGGKVEQHFLRFREWLFQHIRESYQDSSEKPVDSFVENSDVYVQAQIPLRPEDRTPLYQHSHLGIGRLKTLKEVISKFNWISGRYSALQERRLSTIQRESMSYPERVKEYDPSDKPSRILKAIADRDESVGGLTEKKMSEIWVFAYRSVVEGPKEGKKAIKEVREALRSDMRRQGYSDAFPNSAKELVSLAHVAFR